MPAHAPRSAELGGLRPAGILPLDQRKRRHLRVGDDRNAADIAVGRRDVDGSAKTSDQLGRGVHIVDADIPQPSRRRAHFSRVLRQLDESAYRAACSCEKAIGQIGRRHVLRAPTQDAGVEGLGGRYVSRDQLVPGETSMLKDHVGFSVRANNQPQRSMEPTRLVFRRMIVRPSPVT